VRLALRFRGEVVNFDSRQLYRDLDVGTAKPTPAERMGIPHHGFDLLDPRETISAGSWVAWATDVVGEIRRRGNLPVLVGGTGFYLRALRQGLSPLPTTDPRRRDVLKKIFGGPGSGEAHRWLRLLDPPRAATLAPADRDRSTRAVEVCLETGRTMSELLGAPRSGALAGRWLVLGIRRERRALWDRIHRRVEEMFRSGLEEELARLLERGIGLRAPGLTAIGYPEVAAWKGGAMTLSEAKEAMRTATRQYAKRQETWFRKEPGVVGIDADRGETSFAEAEELVRRYLEGSSR
jgi:tRNA dimethylallyltransferase